MASSNVDRFAAAFKFDHIEPYVQDHLKRVYSCLSITLLAAAAGAYLEMTTHFMGPMGFLGVLVQLGLMGWLYMEPHTPKNLTKRIGILSAFGFMTGVSIGPLLGIVSTINASIAPTAFLGTCAIFLSFTMASLISRDRKFIYLGGFLLSGLLVLVGMGLFSLLFGSRILYQAYVYGGLLIFCGFVLYDTQIIIERRRMGDDDFVWHSVDLFQDFIQIFIRLVSILTQKESDKKKK